MAAGGGFDSGLLHMFLILHILSSRQAAEAQEPKLNSAAHSEPPLMSCLLIFHWQASHTAKPSISGVAEHTLPAVVAKGMGVLFQYRRDCRTGNNNLVYPNKLRSYQSTNK